ncbi:helix-turn-helix transcriptional regulator [Niallia taxi]|nr:helix-turn-helix transcriptional regulator [Niallia taxi]MDE5054858.1 helix-turn-helix transcriptional regulator [Niallia taxi]
MNVFGDRLKVLRGNMSLNELATELNKRYETNISKSMLSRYENGQADPKMDVVRIIADYFNVTLDYLGGITSEPVRPFNPQLTDKDEKDIQKELQKMIQGLEGNSYAAFDGNTLDGLDEEDKELLIQSLENSLRLAKRLAKQKFTPNKYRD